MVTVLGDDLAAGVVRQTCLGLILVTTLYKLLFFNFFLFFFRTVTTLGCLFQLWLIDKLTAHVVLRIFAL